MGSIYFSHTDRHFLNDLQRLKAYPASPKNPPCFSFKELLSARALKPSMLFNLIFIG